jgi:hypothetical protein
MTFISYYNKKFFLTIIAFIILVPIIIFVTGLIDKKKLSEYTKGYTNLNYEEQIDNVVIDVLDFKIARKSINISYVTLDNNDKIIINTFDSYSFNERNIHYVLKTGDRLIKKSFNDSLYVIKNKNDSILFILKPN